MKPSTAFDDYQSFVNADPEHVKEARRRRNVFCNAFMTLKEVRETIPSGSLARGTQRDPIHDVDLIVVFDDGEHPDWDDGAGSAEAALLHTRELVTALLGATVGTFAKEVRRVDLRNHVVKCFLDDPDDPDAFAVEVMPALRRRPTLRVPERVDDRWATVDPEFLIRQVAARHAEWRYFAPMVRVVKAWKDVVGLDMKSLVAEVLALNCLPRPAPGVALTRSEALKRFFTAAGPSVMGGVSDPSGWCGEIQPDLDRHKAYGVLREAADMAARAVEAEQRGDNDTAVCTWRAIFGSEFPTPLGGCPGGGSAAGGAGALLTAPTLIRRPIKEAPQG
jgi:predicted nucleotidyltransferase